MSNSHKLFFHTSHVRIATLLELLYLDLWTLFKLTMNGEKYILFNVDNYSRYTQIFLLKSKD